MQLKKCLKKKENANKKYRRGRNNILPFSLTNHAVKGILLPGDLSGKICSCRL